MSVKNNSYLAAAAVALGIGVFSQAPIVEALLNNIAVSKVQAAEISDASGRVVVFVTVKDDQGVDVVRPVADSAGNVRLYPDGSSVVSMTKRTNLAQGAAVTFVRAVKVASVGDPVATLKSKYKSIKAEAVNAGRMLDTATQRKSAAESLGWDDAVGTPEHDEYADLVRRADSITEWLDASNASKATLAAALTAAGVDPATVV